MKRFLRTFILSLVRLIGAPRAFIARGQEIRSAPRILLIRPDHLGDLILTTPILQALRDCIPDAHMTMLVGPWSRVIVERHGALDRVITCPFPGFQRAIATDAQVLIKGVPTFSRAKALFSHLEPYQLLFKTAKQLREERYDLAINLRPDFWWGAALIYLAGIPQRIGYAIEPATPFLTQALPFPSAEHATISNLRLADAALQYSRGRPLPCFAKPYQPDYFPLYFQPTTDEREWVAEHLLQAGIGETDPIVVIHPGTGGTVKLWRPEAWAHIANSVMTQKILPIPARIILTGNSAERPLLEEIVQKISKLPMPLLMTDMTVGQLAALLARAQLVLGVDNGPLHLATAQDTATIRLFGPTDSHIFGPWGDHRRNIVIASTQKCPTCPTIPCGRLDFRPEELPLHPCVRVISEEQVEQAIRDLVSPGGA